MDVDAIKEAEIFKKVFADREAQPAKIVATTLSLSVTLSGGDLIKAQKILRVQLAILKELEERK